LQALPNDPELQFRRGVICHSLGRLQEAEAAYLAALENNGNWGDHFTSVDPGITNYKARHNLALVYADMGNTDLAEVQWRHATALGFRPSQQALRDMLLKQGRTCAAELLDPGS
jgi:Flp pilus assembly protein TadD